MSGRGEIERLSARLERERRARREAELIAERGMREFWRLGHDLDALVAERTAELELELAGLARLHEAVLSGLTDVADGRAVVETLLAVPREAGRPVALAPVTVGDRLAARWLRLLARSGHLLSVDVDPSMPLMTLRWDVLVAAVDVVLAGIHRLGVGGSVSVTMNDLSGSGRAALAVTIVSAPHVDAAGGIDLAELARLTAAVLGAAGGAFAGTPTSRECRCELVVPIVSVGHAGDA